MANKISVTILTKDSSKYIGECLNALQRFDEIIVLDNGSEDDTLEIAKQYANVKIYTSPFIGFGPLKNLAISKASNDWILSVDSDEIFTPEVVEEILTMPLNSSCIYAILRKNYYNHRWVQCCGWNHDYVNRLFDKTNTQFNTNQVHESLRITKEIEVKRLVHSFRHYSSDSIGQLLKKMDTYSSLYAKENRSIKQSSTPKALFRSLFAFVKNYIFQKGFLCGYNGLLISISNANGVFYKYMKLMEENKTLPITLIVTTYNRPKALEIVLLSILKQTRLPLEVIVADDGSDEETKKLIERMQEQFPMPLHHVWQEDKGFRVAKARNGAIREAKGEYLILIDGDMVLHPHFIEDHLHFARKNTFIQGSRVLLNAHKTNILSKDKKYTISFLESGLQNRKNAIHCHGLSMLYWKKSTTLKGIRSCNFALFKEDAYKVNGFDEAFVGWGREDSEFAARLLHAGVKRKDIRFLGIAYHLYHHEHGGKALPENDKRLSETLRDKKAYCSKGLV